MHAKFRLLWGLGWALAVAPNLAASSTAVEYLGHACFEIRSPRGAIVLIDPYSNEAGPGLLFPVSRASPDLVLSSNPLPDHDGAGPFGSTPVFRTPGRWSSLDIEVWGVEGSDGDFEASAPYGSSNTIWVVETGGVRIVHLGANGSVSETALRVIDHADVLMAPVDDAETLLSFADLEQARRRLGARIVIPMRYRHEG